MFTSFRQRLLFCFILIIGISFIIVTLTHFHLLFRNNVIKTTSAIESAYVLVLKDINTKQDFFTYDTRNIVFFKNGESKNLEAHRHLTDSIRATINLAVKSFDLLPYTFDHELFGIEKELKKNQVLFDSITLLIQKRGYKDYNLEGSMRNHIHWLENNNTIPDYQILTLRRLEKDYIIRNEYEYVSKLNALGAHMLLQYATGRDSVKYHLEAYTSEFNQIVVLDAKIGLKDNAGLKQQLDLHTNKLEQALNHVVVQAREKQDRSFSQLNKAYIALISFLMLLSIVASIIIARKITKPLTELTAFITRFIDSQFTVEEQTPPVRSQDEIGKLTANFTLLKNEVISHLRFFKQKVDERTAELQTAHKKLIETNEANSRFVPKEFLDLLGKNSVVEVSPGDQVAGEMTVLFTDIRSFTEISESLSPQDNFDFINGYLQEIVPVIRANNGVIDKFIGDMVMAIFPGSPDDAIKAALGFTEAVERFNLQLAQKGIAPIAIGTGIHMGQLVLGTVGNAHRLETTVISDAVNIASRIEGLTKYYQAGIIVSEEVLQHVQQLHGLSYRYLDEVRVKGKLRSIRVYEVLHPEHDRRKVMFLRDYETAVMYLKQKKFSEALVVLSELSLKNPQDNLPKILLQRCQKLVDHGIPDEWDGIEIMHSK